MTRGALFCLTALLVGCAALRAEDRTLAPPPGTISEAVSAMEEGNRLFAARQWTAAKVQYEAAIRAQPSLAEAHYNLALALEVLGDDPAARQHYIEAANLAPGHKVIWDSPPLRRHGIVESQAEGRTLIMPAIGGH
jgi:Tfp pilus assembly protein PilF